MIDKEYEFTIPHFFEELAADDLEFADINLSFPNARGGDLILQQSQ